MAIGELVVDFLRGFAAEKTVHFASFCDFFSISGFRDGFFWKFHKFAETYMKYYIYYIFHVVSVCCIVDF